MPWCKGSTSPALMATCNTCMSPHFVAFCSFHYIWHAEPLTPDYCLALVQPMHVLVKHSLCCLPLLQYLSCLLSNLCVSFCNKDHSLASKNCVLHALTPHFAVYVLLEDCGRMETALIMLLWNRVGFHWDGYQPCPCSWTSYCFSLPLGQSVRIRHCW